MVCYASGYRPHGLWLDYVGHRLLDSSGSETRSMTYIIAGLLCSAHACVWQIPVNSNTYRSEPICLLAIQLDQDDELVKFRDGASLYKMLKCRLTDTRGRME